MAFDYSYNMRQLNTLNDCITRLRGLKNTIQNQNSVLNSSCSAIEIQIISNSICDAESKIDAVISSISSLESNIASVAERIKEQEEAEEREAARIAAEKSKLTSS